MALTLLGSTGSIGTSTLAVADHLGLPVHGLSAHRSMARLAEQIAQHRPAVVAVADDEAAADLSRRLGEHRPEILLGAAGLEQLAADPGGATVLTAIVGAAGLAPTMAAVQAGKRVAIANKEPLVMAGEQIIAAAATHGATLLPVDSEHSAIFQCLEGHVGDEVERLILTASGGPFRGASSLAGITPEQALQHPNWDMGPKITIDSATLMNKALELIEAHWLFAMPLERIEVLIHPQSIIHSMVAYRDGSVMAQLGLPDMRTPIQYALTWPRHCDGPVACPDFTALGSLTFEPPDEDRFPSLRLARSVTATGGLAPCAFNAANEVAVADFLAGRIAFTDIWRVIEDTLADLPRIAAPDIADILALDRRIRARSAVGSD